MGDILNLLEQNPKPIQDVEAVYQFEFTDEADAVYQFVLKYGTATLIKGKSSEQVDCNFIMSTESFENFLSGKLKGTMAFMTGKLKLKGDLSKALQLEAILKQYQSL